MNPQNQEPSPTIRDVARLAGVSVATISRYLNQTAVVSQDTARRVQEAMSTLKYVPHEVARNLATRKTHTLGLLLTEIQGDFFTPLLKGVESTTSAAGYALLISTAGPDAPNTPALGPQNTDGILVFFGSLAENTLRDFHQKNFPMVLIHQSPPPGLEIPCVTIENKSAARRIVCHLIEKHNRRRIAYLSGPADNEDAYWRDMGYREALAINGFAYHPELVLPGEFDRVTARKSTLQLLQTHPEVDAIFACDDETAIGALAALGEIGKRVPEDIAVVGFDDQVLAPFLTPALTTVHAPTEVVGRMAARQLLNILQGQAVEPLTLLPSELIIRRSCGCDYPPKNIQ